MSIGECKICKEVSELANSHIIPEFCYSTLYNDNHKMVGITGKDQKPTQKVQKGIREYLLCTTCEKNRNTYIEQPYQRDWEKMAIPSKKLLPGSVVNISVNFEVFRKFHLSILYLASVAKNGTWSEVSLGPHEEVLRRYIKGEIELSTWEYPITGVVMVQQDGTVENRLMLSPSKSKSFGATFYGLTFCGVRWGYFVSSHKNHELSMCCMKPSGDLSMYAELWSDFRSVHDLKSALLP